MRHEETEATARRVGPLLAIDSSGVAVTGQTFAGAGELEVSIAGGAWAAGGGSIAEIGGGYYYYQASDIEAASRPFFAVKLAVVCEEFTLREDVERVPSGIDVNEPDASERVIGPLAAFDSSGAAVTGQTFAGVGELEISINGDAWQAAAGSIVEESDGYYHYAPALAEIATRGWIAVKLAVVCEEFVLREDIVDSEAPSSSAVTPIGDVAEDDELTIDTSDESSLAYVAIFATMTGTSGQLCVYRRGAFVSPFDANSYTTTPATGTTRFHVRHNTGWTPGSITLYVDAVDLGGRIDA